MNVCLTLMNVCQPNRPDRLDFIWSKLQLAKYLETIAKLFLLQLSISRWIIRKDVTTSFVAYCNQLFDLLISNTVKI